MALSYIVYDHTTRGHTELESIYVQYIQYMYISIQYIYLCNLFIYFKCRKIVRDSHPYFFGMVCSDRTVVDLVHKHVWS